MKTVLSAPSMETMNVQRSGGSIGMDPHTMQKAHYF